MATFSTQFHATLDELVDFVEKWATAHSLYITAVHHPFRAEPMSVGHVEEVLSAPTVVEVVFTVKPPDLSDPTGFRFSQNSQGSYALR